MLDAVGPNLYSGGSGQRPAKPEISHRSGTECTEIPGQCLSACQQGKEEECFAKHEHSPPSYG